MNHTKEPWRLETVKTQVGICHKIGPFPGNDIHEEGNACIYSDNTSGGRPKELLANAERIVACVNACAGIDPAAIPALIEALERIERGEGRFSTDPLTHAANCIEDMKQIASTAILAARGEG